MLLDFSKPWTLVLRSTDRRKHDAETYAADELAALIERMTGIAPCVSDSLPETRFFVLDAGSSPRSPGGRGHGSRFSWRAAEDRVELWGEDGHALLRSVYDFLRALGARWVAPGPEGERLVRGRCLELASTSGASAEDSTAAVLALGHDVYLEHWREELVWAARAGYASVIVRLTRDPLALEAARYDHYLSIKDELASFAERLGLDIELAGDLPWESLAGNHPEARVFHFWPEELPGGEWRSSGPRPPLPPLSERIAASRRRAELLARIRPEAGASVFISPEDELPGDGIGAVHASRITDLELLWAPRARSWGRALGDAECRMNTRVLESFAAASAYWKKAGGGRITVVERWEDGLLFGGAVPPLGAVLSADIAAYRAAGAEAVGALRAGCRRTEAPRPTSYLVPLLCAQPSSAEAGALIADWAAVTYGAAASAMLDYQRELECAWSVGLDLEEGETGIRDSGSGLDLARRPPADWGDPWKSEASRLEAKRARCEELFDHLRNAEKALAAARDALGDESGAYAAVCAEQNEYAVSGTLLELMCARLSACHELAAGDERAAADIANLALSISGALKAAFRRCCDKQTRAESVFLVRALFDLGLRSLRRAAARSGLRKLLEVWIQTLIIKASAARIRRFKAVKKPSIPVEGS